MIETVSGTQIQAQDNRLSRYACYLVAALCSIVDTSIIWGAVFKSLALAGKLENKAFEVAALAEQGFNSIATWLTIDQAPETGVYSVSFGQLRQVCEPGEPA